MGTRADFYIGRGPDMLWLGSIAMDGDPNIWLAPTNPERLAWDLLTPAEQLARDHERPEVYLNIPFDENPLVLASTRDEYLAAAMHIIDGRTDGTPASAGWPWPWRDSSGSCYAYAFEDGELHVSQSGGPWYQPHRGESCSRWPLYETLCQAQSELRAEAQREATLRGTSKPAMTPQLIAGKVQVEQAQRALDALDCPAFPDMRAVKNLAMGLGSGQSHFARGGVFVSAHED